LTAATPTEKPFSSDTRLTRRFEFDHMRKAGQRYAGRYCVLVTAEPLDGCRRVSIVNSRRFSTKAVVRNRARRLLREAYRLLFPRLTKPTWVLLIPRRYLQHVRMPVAYDELEDLFRRAGILSAEADATSNECRKNGAEPR